MEWGFFTIQHIITIILTFAFTIAMYFILRRLKDNTADKILFILSFFGYAGIIGNLIIGATETSVLYKLPLHLCSWNAILLPFAVKTKDSKLCTTLSVWSIGALIAIVLNDEAVGYTIMGPKFLIYYVPHVIEFAIPLLLVALNKFNIRIRDILYAILITMIVYTVAYGFSELICSYGYPVNYLFTMGPTNFITEYFYNILPYKYFYMFTTFPIIILLYLAIFLANKIICKNMGRADGY